MIEQIERVASELIAEKFPTCNVAILAGSFVRGGYTKTSDLDIVIIDDSYQSSFRQSFYYQEYPIECFIHNKESIWDFIKSDIERARPSLLKMISEGIVLKDDGTSKNLKEDMDLLLLKGPAAWTINEKKLKQYLLTDALDDFEGCNDVKEGIFIASSLAENLHEFILRMNGMWVGSGKWIYRALSKFDEEVANKLYYAVSTYYKTDNKELLIKLTDEWLTRYGGRIFNGFHLGTEKKN